MSKSVYFRYPIGKYKGKIPKDFQPKDIEAYHDQLLDGDEGKEPGPDTVDEDSQSAMTVDKDQERGPDNMNTVDEDPQSDINTVDEDSQADLNDADLFIELWTSRKKAEQ